MTLLFVSAIISLPANNREKHQCMFGRRKSSRTTTYFHLNMKEHHQIIPFSLTDRISRFQVLSEFIQHGSPQQKATPVFDQNHANGYCFKKVT